MKFKGDVFCLGLSIGHLIVGNIDSASIFLAAVIILSEIKKARTNRANHQGDMKTTPGKDVMR